MLPGDSSKKNIFFLIYHDPIHLMTSNDSKWKGGGFAEQSMF